MTSKFMAVVVVVILYMWILPLSCLGHWFRKQQLVHAHVLVSRASSFLLLWPLTHFLVDARLLL
jgi:hypothetical protein